MTGPRPDPASAAAAEILPGSPARVGVAVSGGPDSLAALVVVARICGPRGVPVVALHVDHGLRPGQGTLEQQIVDRVARSVGVPVCVRKVDVAFVQARDGGSTEFVARLLRHRALDEMAIAERLTHVVLAHHLDDQIETVLLAILRGAWPAALGGMPVRRPMPCGATLIRPFLGISRAALRAHSASLGPASDAMNQDIRHRRVAVREILLPALRAASDATDAMVLAVADSARAVDARALALTESALQASYREPGVAVFPAGPIWEGGRFARARFLRRLCDDDAAFGHATWHMLGALAQACEPGAVFAIEVRRGVRLLARQGTVSLFSDPRPHATPLAITWDGRPASFQVDAVRRLRIEPCSSPIDDPGRPAQNVVNLAIPRGARIEVRTRRSHDRFPLENTGHKLVSNELSDRKIQPVWRSRIPIVFVDGALRWIAGLRAVHGPGAEPRNVRLTIDGPMPWVP